MAIHIALTFDDNFWAPAFATMRSVCLFTTRRQELVFHLCHRTLSAAHRADLEAITDEFPVTLRWHDLDQSEMFADIAARMPENKRLSNIVYARLMIDRLVGPDVERILYLDCDMLVRDDIALLYETDLKNHAIGAVRDTSGAFITGGRDLRANRDLFDPASYYFNAGLVLIDVARWRDADIIGRMEEAYATGVMQRIYYDQDLLNLIFRDRWFRLPWRWNVIDARPVHEGLDPAILHYTGENKPWGVLAGLLHTVAFARLYRHVMTNDLFYRFARHRRKRWWKKTLRIG
ncbi:Lipopolysaccharide biosynthesis protein, LPS:glycosyltransferase [Devosia lucknowensis]|uniref:Lipopolysaccharide biosynthesis protein, LPS:glycosyltransferase n=1 Tax=Devosia lucknowensis TaxID=1096929 RepID=A0A1Y6G6E5_9HYPH|nr:glycosyltransferase family 8 protein [Devosia lucknowensis]SMQ85715.1 Lipopolysaccharide biosynthesis protein, LPS:glycosyltransferase [Devosia lucknowensis]